MAEKPCRCGGPTYRPEDIGMRRSARRCRGCHRTVAYCDQYRCQSTATASPFLAPAIEAARGEATAAVRTAIAKVRENRPPEVDPAIVELALLAASEGMTDEDDYLICRLELRQHAGDWASAIARELAKVGYRHG